jgi:hypothetical protein
MVFVGCRRLPGQGATHLEGASHLSRHDLTGSQQAQDEADPGAAPGSDLRMVCTILPLVLSRFSADLETTAALDRWLLDLLDDLRYERVS